MSFEEALRTAHHRPADPDLLSELARAALREGEEERALPALEKAVTSASNAKLWQWKGLLERALDEHEKALASFGAAAGIEPTDPSIAHGRARVALEAGIPAEELYERARALAPADGSVLIGLAAARLAAGHGEQAEAELDAALLASPLWIEGHHQLAQLRSMLGRSALATASLERALAPQPDQPALWQALFDLRVKSENFAELDNAVAAGRRATADLPFLRMYEAIAAAEQGQTDRADAIFGAMPSGGAELPVWLIRHLLRTGRVEEALPVIDRELREPRAPSIWPYAAVAWRLSGDERWDWLEGGGRMLSIVDLTSKLPPLGRLAELLRSIHKARGEYLDQSLRGGTQTDGPLFSRIDPEIRALRAAIVEAVEAYVEQLPAADAAHPLLGQRRDRRVRFAGSWSVRLKEQGFHVPHVHPQGWISSALYIALPPGGDDSETKAGWLQIGEPRSELNVGLQPVAHVEPKPGQLVLFPSWMWHGTIPFQAGERLSVAFDVALPR